MNSIFLYFYLISSMFHFSFMPLCATTIPSVQSVPSSPPYDFEHYFFLIIILAVIVFGGMKVYSDYRFSQKLKEVINNGGKLFFSDISPHHLSDRGIILTSMSKHLREKFKDVCASTPQNAAVVIELDEGEVSVQKSASIGGGVGIWNSTQFYCDVCIKDCTSSKKFKKRFLGSNPFEKMGLKDIPRNEVESFLRGIFNFHS